MREFRGLKNHPTPIAAGGARHLTDIARVSISPLPARAGKVAGMSGFLRLQMHFLATRVREAFSPPEVAVPPPRLRHRVHGSTDIAGYLAVGSACWASVERLLREVGRDPADFEAILDFGCGSGRMIRSIPPASAGRIRTLTGVDIDAAAIQWSRRHLPGIRFEVVAPEPPTAFSEASFDLIVAVSVFTHLDEDRQFALLAEMHRLLRPGGVLVASVHGEHHRRMHGRNVAMDGGFGFTVGRTGLLKKDGLPDFYQDAQHTRAYVEARWSDTLRVVRYEERGMAGHQDAVVAVRDSAS